MNKKAQKILETTTRLFLRDGVKKITMDEIAEAAKASKVTIYKYFADKDTLYLHVGRAITAAYAAQLRAVAASQEPLTTKLRAALDSIAAFSDSGKYALCGELAAYNHAVEAELAAYGQTCRDTLYALIDAGLAEDRMKPGLDREMLYHYIDMGVVYYRQNADYRAKLHNDPAFQSRYMQFFINNVFADGASLLPDA